MRLSQSCRRSSAVSASSRCRVTGRGRPITAGVLSVTERPILGGCLVDVGLAIQAPQRPLKGPPREDGPRSLELEMAEQTDMAVDQLQNVAEELVKAARFNDAWMRQQWRVKKRKERAS